MRLPDLIKECLPECCRVGYARVSSCPPAAQGLIRGFLKNASTAIVLAHHVETSLEWTWFPFRAARRERASGADLHAKHVIETVAGLLEAKGFEAVVLPYPGPCGISFPRLAARTRLGGLGDNFLFLHRKWGPWAHLRIALTDARLPVPRLSTRRSSVCTHCGRCLKSCPAKAITPAAHLHDVCAKYFEREARRRHVEGHVYTCEVCLRACPVGAAPRKVTVAAGR
jgi:ferredoxin